jgi:hypothetical protein
MTMVEISDETIRDIKDTLQQIKADKSQLRINGSIG